MNSKIDIDALIENERKFRLLAENSIDCLWTLDRDLRITYLSPSVKALFGAKPEDWIGTELNTHFKKKEFLTVRKYAVEALVSYKKFKGITFETRILNNNNQEVDVEVNGKVARDDNGKLIGLQGTVRVITEQKKIRNALIENRRLLSTLMSNLPGMVYRCQDDENWTMEFISDGCLKLTGYTASELIDNQRIAYSDLVHPDDVQMVRDSIARTADDDFTFTYRIITRNGTEKWVFERGQRIPDKNGKPMLEGFIIDISEQKRIEYELVQSLSEKNILLSEIHHRVKNNLQLIISLLEIQKPDLPDEFEPILNDIIERVRIFADIHQDLYQSDTVSEINITEHIRSIFNSISQSYAGTGYRISLELDIPHPYFSLETAIPIGLLVNELISNSFKHAFNVDEGMISISIICSARDRIKTITYSDSGRDLVITKTGFGSVLLNAMAAQLNLSMKIAPDTPGKFYFS